MSRFAVTTFLAIAAATAAHLGLHDGWRYVGVAAVWVVYLPIFCVGMVNIRMQYFCPAVCRGVPGKMRVALTFDDGPDPIATSALLQLLQREKIEAAFFCIGKKAAAHPAIALDIAERGHLLANHTYRHPWSIGFLFGQPLVREFERTQKAIEQAAGVTPKYLRPPMGITNPHFAQALRKTGLTLVGWDVRSFDTIGSANAAVERVVRHAKDGSIILLHDGGVAPERVTFVVEQVIQNLRARGFAFERLDRLIEDGPKEIMNPLPVLRERAG